MMKKITSRVYREISSRKTKKEYVSSVKTCKKLKYSLSVRINSRIKKTKKKQKQTIVEKSALAKTKSLTMSNIFNCILFYRKQQTV